MPWGYVILFLNCVLLADAAALAQSVIASGAKQSRRRGCPTIMDCFVPLASLGVLAMMVEPELLAG